MSTRRGDADDKYEADNDATGGDVPAGDAGDNDYVSRTGQGEIPVQKDSAPVDDPIDPVTADSDQMLDEDEKLAQQEGETVKGRTRGAKPTGTYQEPGDEEGLPDDDGTSAVRTGGM